MIDTAGITRDAADQVLKVLPDEIRDELGYINPKYVDFLADVIQDFAAELISSVIDQGSERDAVNENETLRAVLRDEVRGWAKYATSCIHCGRTHYSLIECPNCGSAS
jgi:hypothetical protein